MSSHLPPPFTPADQPASAREHTKISYEFDPSTASGFHTRVEPKSDEHLVCDLCSTSVPPDCRTYVLDHIIKRIDSQGREHYLSPDWAACPECAALIDGDDLVGLVQRSVNLAIAREPELRHLPEHLLALAVQETREVQEPFLDAVHGRA